MAGCTPAPSSVAPAARALLRRAPRLAVAAAAPSQTGVASSRTPSQISPVARPPVNAAPRSSASTEQLSRRVCGSTTNSSSSTPMRNDVEAPNRWSKTGSSATRMDMGDTWLLDRTNPGEEAPGRALYPAGPRAAAEGSERQLRCAGEAPGSGREAPVDLRPELDGHRHPAERLR